MEFPKCVILPYSWNSKKPSSPPHVWIFHFFSSNPSELPAGFANMSNLACQKISNDLTSVLQYSWLQRDHSRKFWNENFQKMDVFSLQPTLTLHCFKLVQKIKTRISCDECEYTQKEFELQGQQSLQTHEFQKLKWCPQSEDHALH